MSTRLLHLHNGEAAPLRELPLLAMDCFRDEILARVADGARIASLFCLPSSTTEGLRMVAVLARDSESDFVLLSSNVNSEYPSLTPNCPQAHLFEREIFEQWGVLPKGHPWLKPVRRPAKAPQSDFADNDFYQVEGEEIHEVAVGPVHAGVIEPGHFRFQCHGETIHHLEISLGYQHRGIEQALRGGPTKRTIHYMETAAGDTSIGHTIAYAQSMEALCRIRAPLRAEQIRGIALELERMANHTGDLGALAGDVGFLPTSSFCGRLRGDFLNMTALLCGNRFGRGLVCPGGVSFDLDNERSAELLQKLDTTFSDVRHAVELLWDSPSVMARFENVGVLSQQDVTDLGLVGPVARASGIERDARYLFPHGIYTSTHLPLSRAESGDVFARAFVRWLELQRSYEFIRTHLVSLMDGDTKCAMTPLAADQIAVSIVEAWRGEICHVAITDTSGKFQSYKIVDPSFHNWLGLALTLREEDISDFPLCNKSFNLSYCGHDL